MSYASVLAENAPPVDDQPKPDPNLLEGQGDHLPKDKPQVEESRDEHDEHHSSKANKDSPSPASEKDDQIKQRANKVAKEGKRPLEDPPNQAAAISLVNVITLSVTALIALKYWNKPQWDKRVVSAIIVGVSAVMGGQGYLVNRFTNFKNKP